MDIGYLIFIAPLLLGVLVDRIFGDPAGLPHPIVGFGNLISAGEKRFNRGYHRVGKGAVWALALIAVTFTATYGLMRGAGAIYPAVWCIVGAVCIFFGLAGKTLEEEVRMVFQAVDRSLKEGRTQVARIVGRDTSGLSAQQIRTAALETLAENLGDGVIAPLFWYMLLGVPGIMAYKMINTLDSMIGYKNERYRLFGRWAARIDDAANYIPARLTAGLMITASGRFSLLRFVVRYGKCHSSPNSGYPEAALAGILDCRFGGPNSYFGQTVEKPYIGNTERKLTDEDMRRAIRINRRSEGLMVVIVCIVKWFIYQWIV